jgi:hypothetical protein
MFDLLSAHEIRAMMKPLVMDILEGSTQKRVIAMRRLGVVKTNLPLRRIFLSLVADYARRAKHSQPATVISLPRRPSSSAPPPIAA